MMDTALKSNENVSLVTIHCNIIATMKIKFDLTPYYMAPDRARPTRPTS